MAAPPLLIAAGPGWVDGILPLLFLLVWIVSQVRALFRAAGDGRRAGPVAERPVASPADVEGARRELVRHIEELVRRSQGEEADEHRAATAKPRGRGGPPGRGGRPPQPHTRRPPKPERPRPGTRPDTAPAAPPSPPLGSLGGHATDVARHVAGAFAQDIDHLSTDLVRPEVATSPARVPAGPALEIAAWLRHPATLRQLVIVREVLDRPVERW